MVLGGFSRMYVVPSFSNYGIVRSITSCIQGNPVRSEYKTSTACGPGLWTGYKTRTRYKTRTEGRGLFTHSQINVLLQLI